LNWMPYTAHLHSGYSNSRKHCCLFQDADGEAWPKSIISHRAASLQLGSTERTTYCLVQRIGLRQLTHVSASVVELDVEISESKLQWELSISINQLTHMSTVYLQIFALNSSNLKLLNRQMQGSKASNMPTSHSLQYLFNFYG
jgi:hypothetical protein